MNSFNSLLTAFLISFACCLLGGNEPVQGQDAAPKAKAADINVKDWAMWGGTVGRNMISKESNVTFDFDLKEKKNVVWSAQLGSQTYGNPIVAGGKVFVGTNNGAEYRPKHKGDKGILLCFDAKTGEFVWQLTRDKLPTGRVNDWPLQGICSTPVIEGDRMWVVSNRCELMCLDVNGFTDGKNDGEYKKEADSEAQDADIIWSLDMIEDLGVFPHNLATSSPVIYKDTVFIVTSNGVDEAHLDVPSPRAPCFIAVDKNTGKLLWENNDPFDTILHGQWGSPAVGVVNGKPQVYMPGGDGWLYAFDASDPKGKLAWKFDLNPKATKWELGGAGTRNAIISTPVFYENSVFLAVGQDPEHGEGTGHFWRIDATKSGDISPELGEINKPGKPNPNSGVIWHYGGTDKEGENIFRRTMSTASIADGIVYLADLSGFVHAVDLKTGKRRWKEPHDLLSGVWGSTLVVDGKVLIGNEDGKLTILKAGGEEPKLLKEFGTVKYSSIYSTPTIAGDIMYLSDRNRLYAINIRPKK